MTVGKAALTVKADNKTITYGDDAPVYTAQITGFVNGETSAVLGGTLTFDCSYTKGDDVGTYDITPKGLTSSNYDITYEKGTLTVSKEKYEIEAPADLTATYGDTLADVELPTDPNGTWSWKDAITTPVGDVGENPFTLIFTPNDTNYDPVEVSVTVIVSKADYPGTVEAPTGLTATYGDTLANVTLPKNDDGTWSWKAATTTSVGNAGENPFTLIFTPNDPGYNTKEVEAKVTVGKAALTVKADNKTITYGDDAPVYTAQITGFVNGETSAVLGGTLTFDCSYTKGDDVGTYDITPKGLTSSNYDITYEKGALTVTEQPVPTPTAPTARTLTYNAGLQNLILSGSAEHGTMVYSLSKEGPWSAAVPQAKDAGTYTVWYMVNGDDGYSDTAPNSVTAVINKAPLKITALDRRASVGERMPAFAYEVDGLLGSDTLDKAPSFRCDANMNIPGTYVIRIFGAEAANYDISYVNGILTVENRFVVSGYRITVVVVGKGEASASAGWANAGSVISVSSKADSGYTLGGITVETESGRNVAMKDGKFTMPNDSVVVTVTFEKKGEPFYDVRPGDWFYDAVIWAYENGIMDGMDIGWFQPDGTVSRAMAVTVLYRMEGRPAVSGNSGFTDVVSGSWYDDAVTWASKNGIVLGVTEDTYRPNDPITREQLAAILYRYAGYKGYYRSASADLTGHADYAEISAYAVPALRWACGCGIIDGSASKLEPRSGATRAQLATMLMRFYKAAR